MSEFPTLAEVLAPHADYVSNGVRYCTCGTWGDDSETAQHSRLAFMTHVREVWMDACTITTVEQLESLPVGVILIYPDVQFTPPPMFAKYTGGWKFMDMGTFAIDISLPARLIWHPEWSET